MKLKSKNVKRIHILATDGNEPSKVVFEVLQPLKKKKVTSTWFPELLGKSNFNTKGDKVLEFYGLAEGEPFNNYYSLRGFVAERIIQDALKSKGYNIAIFKDNFDAFQHDGTKDDKLNTLYKYFGGLPDIVYTDDKGNEILVEVKSKDLEKLDYVKNTPPETEIMQGRMLAFLKGLDKVAMTYVLFSEEVARKMYLCIDDEFNLANSVKMFDDKMPNLKYKVDYDIIRKDYDVKPQELLQQMKEAYKYADGFRQTLTVLFSDLSSDIRKQIFALEKELEE